MGITFVEIRVINPAQTDQSATHKFLVDSGAVYTVMPDNDLRALGLEPSSTEVFILANGERIEMPVGNAYFEYLGKIRAAPVVFGDDGIYLLGATTLEALGFILDPIHRQLKPLPMSMMSLLG